MCERSERGWSCPGGRALGAVGLRTAARVASAAQVLLRRSALLSQWQAGTDFLGLSPDPDVKEEGWGFQDPLPSCSGTFSFTETQKDKPGEEGSSNFLEATPPTPLRLTLNPTSLPSSIFSSV